MDIDTYTLIHFYFHSVQCIQDIVRVKGSFNYLRFLVLLLYACHLREIIAILDWIHGKGVN